MCIRDRHYVGLNVLFQWLGMLCNVVLVMTVSRLIPVDYDDIRVLELFDAVLQ